MALITHRRDVRCTWSGNARKLDGSNSRIKSFRISPTNLYWFKLHPWLGSNGCPSTVPGPTDNSRVVLPLWRRQRRQSAVARLFRQRLDQLVVHFRH